MAYPIIPLIQTWDNPLSQTADIASTKYGTSGVEHRKLKGINPLSNSIDINVNIRNFIEVDNFLAARRNLPFRLSDTDNTLYICSEHNIRITGNNVANFTGTFEQVRRFV